MKHLIKLWIFVIFVISPFLIWSQNGSIQGRLYNLKTNEPLEFGDVMIEGLEIVAVTDLSGQFLFTNIPVGTYRILGSYAGFKRSITTEFRVQANRITTMDVGMSPTTQELSEATVRSGTNKIRGIDNNISFQVINRAQLEKTAGSNRDVSKVLQTLPGVGFTDPNRNDLIVRGGGPAENVFYLDEIEIPVINHFATQGASGGAVGIINPDFVREIKFYTGNFPVDKGQSLSSVMDVRQVDGRKDRWHAKASVGASDAALTADGPIGSKATMILSIRQSYLQLLFSALQLPFLPTYNDFQLKTKIQLSTKDEITIIGIGALDRMKLNTNLTNPSESQTYLLGYLPSFYQWNYTLGANYRHIGTRIIHTLTLSRNMLHNANEKYQDNDPTQHLISQYRSRETENKMRYDLMFSKLPINFRLGAAMKYAHTDTRNQRSVWLGQAFGERVDLSELSLWDYRVYASVGDDYLNKRLRWNASASFSGNSFGDNTRNPLKNFSPRVLLSYLIGKNIDLSLGLGHYVQLPSYTILSYRDSSGNLGNKQAKYIHSDHINFGISYTYSDKFVFSAETFMKIYDQYPISVLEGISMASKGSDFGQIGYEAIRSDGKGYAYGGEFLVRMLNLNGFYGTLAYTVFKSEFSDQNGTFRPSAWDVRHLLNIMLAYQFPKNWLISTRWQYSGGAPFSPIDQTLSASRPYWDLNYQASPDYANYNTLQLGAKHQLDIRLDKEFLFKRWTLNIYIDIQNAYGFKTESAPIYTNLDQNKNPVIQNPEAPYEEQTYRLRRISVLNGTILPTLGIIIKL